MQSIRGKAGRGCKGCRVKRAVEINSAADAKQAENAKVAEEAKKPLPTPSGQ